MSNQNGGKIVGALLIGAALGAALGILFAPEKGSETRKKLIAKSDDLTDGLKDKFKDLLAEAKREVETIKAKAQEMIETGQTKAESVRSK